MGYNGPVPKGIWAFILKWTTTERKFCCGLFFCPKRQNGKNVVADVLSTEKTGGSLSEELGALPGQSSDLAFSRPVGAGANNFYIDREEKEIE